MGTRLQPSITQADETLPAELYLRIGESVFGVSFLDLSQAREAARHINLTGRDCAIYERHGGKVLERSAALRPLPPIS